jgi:hypothetical protein
VGNAHPTGVTRLKLWVKLSLKILPIVFFRVLNAHNFSLVTPLQNSYGDGFYLAFKKSSAAEYARQKPQPTILTTRVNIKNPKKFRDSIEFGEFLVRNNIEFDDFQSQKATEILIKKGYDAIEISGLKTLVFIFNKQQIATFKSERI